MFNKELTMLIAFCIVFCVTQGHPIEHAITSEKHNVTVSLQIGIPENFLNGKVHLEFEFGQKCSYPKTEKITQEIDPLNTVDEGTTKPEIPQPMNPDYEYSPIYRDCNDIPYDYEFSGIHNITIQNSLVTVNCQVLPDGRKFLIFQRRQDGSVDFYRNWLEYAEGFGDVRGEFWLGNINLHRLTSNGNYMLRIEMESFNGTLAYAEYKVFQVGPPSLHFPLTVSEYSGTAGDSLSLHNGAQFTTEDADNDLDKNENCARLYKGGWWYTSCHYANLNGLYHGEGNGKGIHWFHFLGYQNSLQSVKMMLSRR